MKQTPFSSSMKQTHAGKELERLLPIEDSPVILAETDYNIMNQSD